jgi:uncharacterized ferritin-like protein (DUF455 family)
MIPTLAGAANRVLATADAAAKAGAARDFARRWRDGEISDIGSAVPPDRPARPARATLRPPREMPRRRKAQTAAGRRALLHALAHIELNAIDLACDIIARFGAGSGDETLPRAYFDDWVRVADEEALHFTLLADRLDESGAAYGDLPAHDGLWEAAAETAHDLLARLAVVPLVLEARGLDVTPGMIGNLERAGDFESAAVLQRIYHDEIGHVAIGWRWFAHICGKRGLAPETTYRELVRRHFKGALKPPFNETARLRAGLAPELYQPLASRD